MHFSSLAAFSLGGIALVAANPTPSSCTTYDITPSRASQVKASFTAYKIVPDVVPSIEPTIDFRSSYNAHPVNLGNEFSIQDTLIQPNFTFTPSSKYPDANYTIVMVDPDAPSPSSPLLRYFLHIILYDAKPTCQGGSFKTFATYQPLTPLSVAAHRYTQLVYRQPPGTFTPQTQLPADVSRNNFDLKSFVAAGKLSLVGGDFFREGANTTTV